MSPGRAIGGMSGSGSSSSWSRASFASFLFGVGAVSFIFRRRVAFLFRVAAAYVSGGDGFGGVSTLGSGGGYG